MEKSQFQLQINDLKSDLKDIGVKLDTLMTNHLAHLNKEIVDLKLSLNKEMNNSQITLSELRQDVSWLKGFFWKFVTPVMGGMVAAILALVLKK